MTQTTQSRSLPLLNNAGKNLTINKPETEDNMTLLLSVFDSLNNLYKTLSRLNYAVEKRILNQNIYSQNKGEIK